MGKHAALPIEATTWKALDGAASNVAISHVDCCRQLSLVVLRLRLPCVF